MPVTLECTTYPLTEGEVGLLWQLVRQRRGAADELVVVRCVSRQVSQSLNSQFRHIDAPTNVLTFSYPDERALSEEMRKSHDLALCLPVIVEEAAKLGKPLRHYAAWVMVHGLLHATGMDHESSPKEDSAMRQLETTILTESKIDLE